MFRRKRSRLGFLHERAAAPASAWRRGGVAAVQAEALMADRPNEREAESLTGDGRVAGKRAGWIAGEQAALRRVAVLVARAAPPEEVFAAVAAEVGRVLEVDFTYLGRYEPDGAATALAAWAMTGAGSRVRVGAGLELGGRNVTTLVFQTRRPARIDDPDP